MNIFEAKVGDRKEAEELLKTGAPELEPNVSSNTIVFDQDSGEPLVLVKSFEGVLRQMRQAFMAFPKSTVLRAAGTRNVASTFGYLSRSVVMQRYACRECFAAAESPAAHAVVVAAAAQLYESWRDEPETARVAEEAWSLVHGEVRSEWIMPGSPWTSGVLNTTSVLPYHYDRNNFEAWSAMIVARRGMRGGHLHIPQLGVVLDCRDGDVVYFPGWRFVHGVTPMRAIEKDAYRYSAVYYPISKMRHAQPSGSMVRVAVSVPRGNGGGRGRRLADHVEIPIESLQVGDRVVTLDNVSTTRTQLRLRGKAVREIASRPYEGTLITVEAGGKFSRYTVRHLCLAKPGRLAEGGEIVYLMGRDGRQYRVGRTGCRDSRPTGRMHAEWANEMWILSVHETAQEAALEEALVCARFGLPDVCFRDQEGQRSHYKMPVEQFWSKLGGNREQAEACLRSYGLLVEEPLLVSPNGRRNLWWVEGIAAANLRSGMLVPVASKSMVEWLPARVRHEYYSGLVHSLDVEKYHNYVADGIATHNCLSPEEELAHGRLRRTESEDTMIERQRESGFLDL